MTRTRLQIEADLGAVETSLRSYVRVAAALGADVSIRIYPNTGPPIRDRHQARIIEAVLRSVHPRWKPVPEVVVRRPAHGVIDLVLIDPGDAEIVSAEIHSDLHRVEEQLRRAQATTDSLPSSDVWAVIAVRPSRACRACSSCAPRRGRASSPPTSRPPLPLPTRPIRTPPSPA